MSLSESKYRQLKQDVEDFKAEVEQNRGALKQLMSQLEQEFDCKTLKEGAAKLDELKRKAAKAEKEFQTAVDRYERKWSESQSGRERD